MGNRLETFKAGMALWRAVLTVPHARTLLFFSLGGWVLFIVATIGMVVK